MIISDRRLRSPHCLEGKVLGQGVVVVRAGRQLPDEIATADERGLLGCVASGFGCRLVRRYDGALVLVGLIGLMRLPDVVAQDIRGNHLRRADCLIRVWTDGPNREKRVSGLRS